jgi:predicted lipoprotein with Yx(FWY)xxD motif
MTSIRRFKLLAGLAVVPVVALVIAGCGGSSGGSSNASAATPKTTTGQPATVGTGSTDLGSVLVNSDGRTLYAFEKDSGTTSACSAACAMEWPPLLANGKPTAGTGVNAGMLGTTKRSDGGTQVTFNGHPLYTFAGDAKAGDTGGQGLTDFGGSWHALSSSGSVVTSQPSSSSSSTSSGGGSGGGYSY